jgi:hypothetical protein
MSLLDEADPEILISRLAAPLTALAQSAFRTEAYEAMARLAIIGPGSLYRTIAPLQAGPFRAAVRRTRELGYCWSVRYQDPCQQANRKGAHRARPLWPRRPAAQGHLILDGAPSSA